MFSLFFVASLVLPSVLGNCCFPDMYSAVMYDASQGPSDLYVDWTANKYAIVPRGGDMKYVLFDIASKMKYERYDDGSCESEAESKPVTQCLPKSLSPVGHDTLGGSLAVNTFGMKDGDEQNYVTLTSDCLPVIAVRIEDDETHTTIFSNVTISSTTFSQLSEDVSDCKPAED